MLGAHRKSLGCRAANEIKPPYAFHQAVAANWRAAALQASFRRLSQRVHILPSWSRYHMIFERPRIYYSYPPYSIYFRIALLLYDMRWPLYVGTFGPEYPISRHLVPALSGSPMRVPVEFGVPVFKGYQGS